MSNKKENITTKTYKSEEIQKIEEYWTLERLKNAKPILSNLTNQIIENNNINFESTDEILSIAPNKPNINMIILGTPFHPDINNYPYKCTGKIFFTKGNKNYYGTAQFVGDGKVILTAAHCLRDSNTGEFYKNLLFIREYNKGLGEKFGIDHVGTKNAWIGGNLAYDYGFCHTTTSYPYWLGLQTPTSYEYLQAIGYPSNFREGKILYAVNGKKGNTNLGILQMLGNPMRHGNSGGAWIGGTTEGKLSYYVVGLNSFHYDNESNNEYSPLFNLKDIISLFNCVRNKICNPSL